MRARLARALVRLAHRLDPPPTSGTYHFSWSIPVDRQTAVRIDDAYTTACGERFKTATCRPSARY